jgi:hypothetical protein
MLTIKQVEFDHQLRSSDRDEALGKNEDFISDLIFAQKLKSLHSKNWQHTGQQNMGRPLANVYSCCVESTKIHRVYDRGSLKYKMKWQQSVPSWWYAARNLKHGLGATVQVHLAQRALELTLTPFLNLSCSELPHTRVQSTWKKSPETRDWRTTSSSRLRKLPLWPLKESLDQCDACFGILIVWTLSLQEAIALQWQRRAGDRLCAIHSSPSRLRSAMPVSDRNCAYCGGQFCLEFHPGVGLLGPLKTLP